MLGAGKLEYDSGFWNGKTTRIVSDIAYIASSVQWPITCLRIILITCLFDSGIKFVVITE